MQSNNRLFYAVSRSWYILYFTYGLFPIIVGIDKCCNIITYWPKYIHPRILELLHVDLTTFMYLLAALEVFTGLLLLAKPRIGGYTMIALLITVIIELASLGIYMPIGYPYITPQYDTALRALAMLMGAWVFVILTKELKKEKVL